MQQALFIKKGFELCKEKEKRKLKSVLYVKNAERNKILTKIGQQKNGNSLIVMNDVNVVENL